MTKILLLSDTHGHMDDKILSYARQADEVWHAGDIGNPAVTDAIRVMKPLRAVYGNIDGAGLRAEFPKDLRFQCERVKVWMTHIGGYPGRYSPDVRRGLDDNPPDLFICGHTHILRVMRDKKRELLHMNPGAVGKYGPQKVRTMLRFQIEGAEIKGLEVIEMGG